MSSTDADSAARSRSRPQSQSPSAKRRIERSDLGTPAASKSDLNLPTNRPREPSVDKTVLDKSDSDARTPAHTLDAQSDEDEDVEHIDSDTPASQSPTRATIRRRTKPAPVSPRSLDQPPSEEDSKESHSPQPQSPGAESPAPRSPAMRSPAPHTPHAPQTPRSPLLPGSQAPGDRSSSSDQSVAVGVGRKTHWLTIGVRWLLRRGRCAAPTGRHALFPQRHRLTNSDIEACIFPRHRVLHREPLTPARALHRPCALSTRPSRCSVAPLLEDAFPPQSALV